ncbi:hypothetical protein X760_20825 [Mesorhizobium sp. LSHC422A00]|nr:hypothetical protein X760_20825 [Mesorhizobium sp. LSHC422A00]ESZ78573.1 hypothetical protein X726_00905 [Mesorhizobium sp. L103C105A0]
MLCAEADRLRLPAFSTVRPLIGDDAMDLNNASAELAWKKSI